MQSKLPAPIAYLAKNPHLPITILLLSLCIFFWIISITAYPINPDAGYYLTAGKYISNGLVPYRDFHTSYSPGVFYFFSLTEMLGSKFGEYQKALIYFLHILNGVLAGLILRQLKFDNDLAIFAGSLFILASFCLDGQALVLEPFQNVFILFSLLTAVYLSGYKAAFYAGFFMGCALMSKQTSMFSLPIVAALVAFPLVFNLPSTQNKSNFYARLIMFGMMISLPFILFCLATGQSFVTTFIQLATFGGRAKSYVEQEYGLYEVINIFISGNGGERLLIPIVVSAILLMLISKKNIHRLFVVGVSLNLITILFVRGYPHYIQLLLPWGILVFAALIRECNIQNTAHKSVFSALVLIPFISPVLNTAHNLRIQYSKSPIDKQILLSAEINQSVGLGINTIVVGYPWLYYTSKITPPNFDLAFIKTPAAINERIEFAEQVVVMPGYQDMFDKLQSANNTSRKFNETVRLKYDKGIVSIYN